MARFEFNEPHDEDPNDEIIGTAESAGQRIQAVIAHDGRLRELHIAPEVLQRGEGGEPATDSATLALEISRTINAAFDDLVERHAAAAMSGTADAKAALHETATDVERELSRITADLERAQRRLRER